MPRPRRVEEIVWVWDAHLRPGMFRRDLHGIWHVGLGTDLQLLLFEVNLTRKDREWLESLKIGIG